MLSQVTITGGNAGSAGYGGGVFNTGKLTISLSVISGNTAAAGGGIANAGGTLTVTGTTVSHNTAPGYGGGGIQNGGLHNVPGLVTVTNSTITGNTSGGDGGGILNGQNGHPATAHSAAVAVRPVCPRIRRCAGGLGWPGTGRTAGGPKGVNLTVTGTQLTGNTSTNSGGAIASDGGTAVVTSSTLAGNKARQGGGIEVEGATINVVNNTFSGNGGSGIETCACGGGSVGTRR